MEDLLGCGGWWLNGGAAVDGGGGGRGSSSTESRGCCEPDRRVDEDEDLRRNERLVCQIQSNTWNLHHGEKF